MFTKVTTLIWQRSLSQYSTDKVNIPSASQPHIYSDHDHKKYIMIMVLLKSVCDNSYGGGNNENMNDYKEKVAVSSEKKMQQKPWQQQRYNQQRGKSVNRELYVLRKKVTEHRQNN